MVLKETDLELLTRYVFDASEDAFAEVVSRHVEGVRVAVARRVRDREIAEDVAQAVFVVLMKKAPRLVERKQRSLAAWLYTVARYASARAIKARMRREKHEKSVEVARDVGCTAGWVEDREEADALARMLDEAIAAVSMKDREAVLRRFYQRASFAEIAAAMATTAEAARKRVDRALAKMRQWLAREGVVAPIGFEERLRDVSATALKTAVSPVAREAATSIANGAMNMMQQAKTTDFAVVSTELDVTDVRENVAFFEKLGFVRRWEAEPDAQGRLPRASLAGGVGRIWLRRRERDDPKAGAMRVYFWVNGGAAALEAHRKTIYANGVSVGDFFDDASLRSFTVRTPDGYEVGFFTNYR